jgi:hypothetical protein
MAVLVTGDLASYTETKENITPTTMLKLPKPDGESLKPP